MASAIDISPSEEKAFYMRTQALLVDGGTLVLRSLLLSKHPGGQWHAELLKPNIRSDVTKLRNKKVITDDQFRVLYPQVGVTDLSKYDISLMVCLLRHFCGLNTQAHLWNGFPSSTDISEEADIRRLNIERNTIAHSTSASITRQDFEVQWAYIEQILHRLVKNIPDLKQHIDNLKEKSIDPEAETLLQNTIKEWEELDEKLQEDVDEMKKKIQEHDTVLETLTQESVGLKAQTGQLQELTGEMQSLTGNLAKVEVIQDQLKGELTETTEAVTMHESRLNDFERSTRDTHDEVTLLRDNQESMVQSGKMSDELKNLSSITMMFLDDCLTDGVYIHTRLHNEAKEKLENNNIVVLSGSPGEGKTTMAIKLMHEVASPETCLKLAHPSDWRHVDFDKFDTFFIDDIFGPGVLDESLVKGWNAHLPEMWKAVQKKSKKLIITTRHYILEEAKQLFHRTSVFKEEHVQLLSSKDLSIDERTKMLQAHLNDSGIQTGNNDDLIFNCVALSMSFLDVLITKDPPFLFGFPECVSMFVQNEDLLNRGPEFFSNPNHFFRICIEDLKRDEEKFLALLIMWTRPDKSLYESDMDMSSMPDEISNVSKRFGFKLKGKLLKTLRSSLKHHTNGFLRYSSSRGAYKFSHNIIGDMIGLVISEDYPGACLDFTDRDFLLEYITIKESEKGTFRFFVEEHLHERLMKTIIQLAEISSEALSLIDLLLFKRGGHRPNMVNSSTKYDASVFFHDVFSDESFVSKFVNYLVQSQQANKVLARPIMKMSGYFLSYGFELSEMDIFLPTYTLLQTRSLLFMELLKQDVISHEMAGEHRHEMYLALLVSAHTNQIDVVKALVKSGVVVTEEAIYVATVKQHLEILQYLLQNSGKYANTSCKFEKNNNALMVAAKKGLTDSVRLLAAYKDVSLRNDHNFSALDKAIIFNQNEITQILIDKGAPINEKGGKFKRTPLHTAADIGLPTIVDQLLKAGANTRIKDHRGHYPIHLAAIQNHVDVVAILANHNPAQVTWRIASYGVASMIKGMTVFHIAVWKDNEELLEALLEISKDCNVQDWFGRTPLYCASYEGKNDIVELLLPHADVNKPEKNGYTPLHAAIFKGRENIIRLLLRFCNVNAKDKFGRTPFHVACRAGFCDIVQELLNLGADPYMLTKRGLTVYDIMAKRNNRIKTTFQHLLTSLLTHFGHKTSEPRVNFEVCFEIIHTHSPSLSQSWLNLCRGSSL